MLLLELGDILPQLLPPLLVLFLFIRIDWLHQPYHLSLDLVLAVKLAQ